MDLYLVQHAMAKPKEEDPARPLSEQGLADIERVAGFAARHCAVTATTVYHSGKLRAEQTAAVLAGKLNLPEPNAVNGLAPLDDPGVWGARLLSHADSLILVGHLPHLGRLSALLLTGNAKNNPVQFQMGCILALKHENGQWSVRWMITPEIIPAA